jgi:hypothetical protein
MRRALLAFLLLFPPAAFAQEPAIFERFYVDPPVVHENEPFDIVVGGFFHGEVPAARRVTIKASRITIDFPENPDGPAMHEPWGERIRIDGLPDGVHEIVVNALGESRSLNIRVHEKPFKLSPRVAPAGDEVVIENLPDHLCEGDVCQPLGVFFGETPSPRVRSVARELGRPVIVAEVPQGTGLVDVSVQLPNGPKPVLVDAFRFGRGLESDYERVLFPSTYAGRGAHGSDWRSEIVVQNDGAATIRTEPLIRLERQSNVVNPVPLEPGERATFPTANRDGGAFLHVGRGAEKWLTYDSHARDLSRTASDRGSEVPVVRADDTASEIRLPDVPMQSLFRSHLRIYDFDDSGVHSVEITFEKSNGTRHVMRVSLPPTPVCVNPPCLLAEPSFAAVDLSAIPALANAGNVDITIRALTNDRRLWAFVSVANNETQRVTVYTPQHKTPAGATR